MEISIILAQTKDNIIGIGSECPFVTLDKEHFKSVTQYAPSFGKNLMIIGRKTWETVPKSMRNCKRRFYLVLSQDLKYDSECANSIVINNIDDAMIYILKNKLFYYKIFCIGGANIYHLICDKYSHFVSEIFLTKFNTKNNFADLYESIEPVYYDINNESIMTKLFLSNSTTVEDNLSFKINNFTHTEYLSMMFYHYERKIKSFEVQYLNLVTEIKNNGIIKNTRNGQTKSINNYRIQVDLSIEFPVLTVRKIFMRGIIEELLWFISGSTDTSVLKSKNINVWNHNSSRQFLDSIGLTHLEENDIGPGYGFLMRYFGAKYINCKSDYVGQGTDQIARCIHLIKTDPDNRRIIINLWDAALSDLMALPPCHMLYQFTIEKTKLNCHLYQRSWDVMLGWNTTTAALLTHMIAHFTGYNVGILTHTICDAHIYLEHIDKVENILTRVPYKPPTLSISNSIPLNITDYDLGDFNLNNYQSHPVVPMIIQ